MWVDNQTENLFDLYQYMVNASDAMLEDLYLRYTFESIEEIESIIQEHKVRPEERRGQLRLAKTLIEMITGDRRIADQIANYRQYFSLNFDEMVG